MLWHDYVYDLEKSWEIKDIRTCCMDSWADWAALLALSIMLLAFSCNITQTLMSSQYWACMHMKRLQREEFKGRPELGPWLGQHCSSCFGSPFWVFECVMKNQVLLVLIFLIHIFPLFVVTYIVSQCIASFDKCLFFSRFLIHIFLLHLRFQGHMSS